VHYCCCAVLLACGGLQRCCSTWRKIRGTSNNPPLALEQPSIGDRSSLGSIRGLPSTTGRTNTGHSDRVGLLGYQFNVTSRTVPSSEIEAVIRSHIAVLMRDEESREDRRPLCGRHRGECEGWIVRGSEDGEGEAPEGDGLLMKRLMIGSQLAAVEDNTGWEREGLRE
jgi:hypothetical protein